MNAIDRGYFFDSVRQPLFAGHMNIGQVTGMTAMLDRWQAWVPHNLDLSPNIRWLANQLAQAHWETGMAMQPVAELGRGVGRDYGHPDPITGLVYYGRGLVQLTWKANYQHMGHILGVDLEHHPDLALDPAIAAAVMLEGMARGNFTGRRLGQYFGADPRQDDPFNARRIINALDQAAIIRDHHNLFLAALSPPATRGAIA